MHLQNQTVFSEFLIIGFQNVHCFRIPLFILFLMIYIATCLESLLIIMLVTASVHLKTPMYIILRSMSSCELVYITNLVPKMLHDILSERPTISIVGCITQLNIFGTMGNSMTLLYALMSYDRYLAISNPLRYSALITNRTCFHATVVFLLISFVSSLVMDMFIGQLKFCVSNVIDHFYCDFTPLVDLSCSDTTYVKFGTVLLSSLLTLLPLLFGFLSYIFIIYTILQIPSATGRKKAFSTCSSHLLVIIMSYGTIIGVYVLPTSTNTPSVRKGLSFMYILVMPLINPIIYTLRNQNFHKAFDAEINQMKKFYWS